jgi:hypothetical protein
MGSHCGFWPQMSKTLARPLPLLTPKRKNIAEFGPKFETVNYWMRSKIENNRPQRSVEFIKSVFALFLGSFAKLRIVTISFGMFVCLSAWNNSASIGRIVMKFNVGGFFENLSRKFKIH